MGQVLIRNVSDETITVFKRKAELKGHSLEQELRDLLERNRPLTADEKIALSQKFSSRYDKIQPSMTLDEIREGLE